MAKGEVNGKPVDWQGLLLRGEQGTVKSCDLNCYLALKHANELASIAYDVRKHALVVGKPGPYGEAGLWTSANTAALAIWLQEHGCPVRTGQVDVALARIGLERKLDPLGDYLLGLQWEGQERMGHWLTTYLGAPETETMSLVGSMFLIGMVERALKPGCQMDYSLVLEGPQGAGKSRVIRVLGGDYVSQNLPDFHSRDAQQIAGSAWIVEVGELAAYRRSDVADSKKFLTTTHDSFIPKYERYMVTRPRWCVFVFNVNPDSTGYLRDQTGNRRFWPVPTGIIDIARLEKDREQLLAEAVYCMMRGDKPYPNTALQHEMLAQEQEQRTEQDEWTDTVLRWCALVTTSVTTSDVAKGALDFAIKDIDRSVSTRIGMILNKHGFQAKQSRQRGGQRVYAKPEV